MAVATYTKSGAKATNPAKLDKAVFGVEVKNHALLHQAYSAYLANSRGADAKTLKRGEVRGGGKKPWKQKGTGRARFGSSRNPIWRGGGVVFGPDGSENYSKKLLGKAKQQSLRQALTLANAANKVKVIETFECKDGSVGPTKKLFTKIGATGKVLLIVSLKDELVDRATRNLENVKAIQANYVSVYDLLNADTVVLSKKALASIHERLSGQGAKQ